MLITTKTAKEKNRMTQLNFTMEMDDLVYLVLQPQNERIAKIATDILNQALEAQCEAQIQAKRY